PRQPHLQRRIGVYSRRPPFFRGGFSVDVTIKTLNGATLTLSLEQFPMLAEAIGDIIGMEFFGDARPGAANGAGKKRGRPRKTEQQPGSAESDPLFGAPVATPVPLPD